MTYLDFNALDRMPLEREPYDYLIVENFILPKQFGDVSRDFPNVPGPGSHPPADTSRRIHGRSRRVNRYDSPPPAPLMPMHLP